MFPPLVISSVMHGVSVDPDSNPVSLHNVAQGGRIHGVIPYTVNIRIEIRP